MGQIQLLQNQQNMDVPHPKSITSLSIVGKVWMRSIPFNAEMKQLWMGWKPIYIMRSQKVAMGCLQLCKVCLNFNVIYVTIFFPSHQNMKNMIAGLVRVSTGHKYGLLRWSKSSICLVKEFSVHSHIYHKKCNCNISDVTYVTMHRDHSNKQNKNVMSWEDTLKSL